MKIEDITIGQLKELRSLLGAESDKGPCPWQIGKNYFIRTVTHHLTGNLKQVTTQELVLSDAAWIADDGRFAQAVESGNFSEVEPFPPGRAVIIGRGSIIDAVVLNTELPRSQK